MPKKKDLPSTLQRSDEHAQAIYSETLESAEKQYGKGERASRAAFAALKHSYEKVGDHWEAKAEKGPSDPGAEESGPGEHDTKGGVDANATKAHLMDVAKRLEIRGRSGMTKDELVEAIGKANDRESRRSLERERSTRG